MGLDQKHEDNQSKIHNIIICLKVSSSSGARLLNSVNSSLGLWLGLSVLSALDKIMDFAGVLQRMIKKM